MNVFKNFNYDKLKSGLIKTRDKLVTRINETLTGKAKIDDATLEEIEEILITSDLGYELAEEIIDLTKRELKKEADRSKINIVQIIKEKLEEEYLQKVSVASSNGSLADHKPYVILIVGINGAGKTTTVGKLAHNFKKAGLKVIVGSADTFRAAANEQLEIWSKRAGVELIQKDAGSDPSSVAFETLEVAKKNSYDVAIIDTAGRLHTKKNLMDELHKIKRVLQKNLDYSPNETLLVVDGNTGQNAIIQAEKFGESVKIDGLVVTKLDGTAKGGSVFQISSKLKIPIKYVGVGEGIEDLQNFDPKRFVEAIFSLD